MTRALTDSDRRNARTMLHAADECVAQGQTERARALIASALAVLSLTRDEAEQDLRHANEATRTRQGA